MAIQREICNKCGNFHAKNIIVIDDTCIFGIVQQVCWNNGVVSNIAEDIAEQTLNIVNERSVALEVNKI